MTWGCKSKTNYSQLCTMPALFKLLFLFLSFLFHDDVILCSGLNHQGSVLLRFRERVERDPLNALSSWNGGGEDADPSSLFGADGRVVALNMDHSVNPVQRRLLRAPNVSKTSRENDSKPRTLSIPPLPHPPPHSSKRLPPPSRASIKQHPSSSPKRSPAPSQSRSHKLHPPAPTMKRTPAPEPSVSSRSLEPSHASKKETKSRVVAIVLCVAIGSLVIIVVATAIVIVCRNSRMVTVKPWATGLSGQLQKAFVSGVPKLKRSELETACEDFSNIIGTLTDSTVYKGTLSNGVEIAVVSSMVKSSREWSKDLQTQFRKKIETLSKVNHKNFVNILGYCEEEKPFTRMMVFEYAPNGTLFEHLHIQESERLDWKMRLRVIMGMAYCLDHMHQLDPPIPHRDLHSSSVHLSEDYAAKVSDFSFWTEATSKKMHSSSMRSPSMQLLESSMADIECNVYSFGVLLFEIITGKIPYADDGDVHDCVWEYLRGEELPRDAIDPTLNAFQEEEMQKLFEIIKDCVNPDIIERPKMRDVVLRLKEVTLMEPDGAVPRISPLWWAELEIMTT